MAVSLQVKSNAKQVQKKFDRFFKRFPNLTKKGLAQASFQLQLIIKELTEKGLDFRRRRFAPYSSGYLKRLQSEGKPQKVDLKLPKLKKVTPPKKVELPKLKKVN